MFGNKVGLSIAAETLKGGSRDEGCTSESERSGFWGRLRASDVTEAASRLHSACR